MNICALLILLTVANGQRAVLLDRRHDADRIWGQPVQGLRSSIKVGTTRISSQGPFVVSIIVENVSEAAINVEKISSFRLAPSLNVPEYAVAGFWCPVDFEPEKPGPDTALILRGRSRLILAKGASLRTTLDLSRHGWAANWSSQWPDRKFEIVTPKGKYQLRLDIELLDRPLGNGGYEWVRSNVVEINIEAP